MSSFTCIRNADPNVLGSALRYKNYTKHFYERLYRLDNAYFRRDYGSVVSSFLVDKHHAQGKELHTITARGLCFVQNASTRKLITVLVLREKQLCRYYELSGMTKDKSFYDVRIVCSENQKRKLYKL